METKINKLSEIDKRNPFTVPEDYFTGFNQRIMDCLPEKETVKPKAVSMWDKTKPWIYMAAMFMGLFFTFQLITRNSANQQRDSANQAATIQSAQFTDDYWSTVKITEEEFYQYLEDQLVNEGYYDYMYNRVYMN
ncbi:MAG TPA: hypothetical protein GXX42_10200 [Petrimonas sp.]|uniref:hypothetical protein n=1 Tax=Petrimonas sp. TaxID=2023866 RepID=UPI00095E02E8|nr:hypothetical protein [Petrimonas sp.]OJV35257.1 MAG: hypothetical protein BGO33_13285 [Bacteroidia bacterium 43-41]MEA4949564.1 hypothetical protein [Petrimonas sp.]MEA4979858.1 hypothetical protein [Petrimonas sp.]MEA5043562.1 hypothetical protein [Petrimonas sp.]